MSSRRVSGVRVSGRRRGDDGTTLVELMVVMTLFGIIGAILSAVVISTQRQSAAVRLRINDVQSARIGMDAMTRTLRTAVQPAQLQVGCTTCTGTAARSTAVSAASATSVQVFANTGATAGPVLTTFTVALDSATNTGQLTQTSQPPDLNSAPNFTYTSCTVGASGCRTTRRTLIRGITWPLTTAAFTYRTNAGTALTIGSTGQLTSGQLVAVDSVEISLPVREPNQFRTAPVTITGRVALANAATGVLTSPSPVTS